MPGNNNDLILERLRGVAAQPSLPEADADPRNPNARPVIGIDLGDPAGDYFAAQCPRCWHVEKWRDAAPKRCTSCHRRHNFAGLHVVR